MKKDLVQNTDNIGEKKPDEVIGQKEHRADGHGKVIEKYDDNSPKTQISVTSKTKGDSRYAYVIICIIIAAIAIFLQLGRGIVPKQIQPKYWAYSHSPKTDVYNPNGILKHVHLVLNRVGVEKSTNYTPWDLLWAHDYPFRTLYPHLHGLRAHQKVNHFPGTTYITHKATFATSDPENKHIPRAFELPKNKEAFLKYALNKNAVFLQKDNLHRGVFLKNVSDVDMSGNSFVQEYIQKPFLVDGHKFDIGVYVVVTSVNPLRVYWYKGDVLFRYCPAKYYPFDPNNLDKYVIGDDYLPTWEVPSLTHSYTSLGFGMKDSFDIYLKSQGKDPLKVDSEIQNALAEVFVKKEHHIIQALKSYSSPESFFELMRFDLILDEDLNVHLLEANMSPNLSSAHFPPNQLLYEQVLYSLFAVTGVSSYLRKDKIADWDESAARNMVTAQKNIATWGLECSTLCRSHCGEGESRGELAVCGLCKHCLTNRMRKHLMRAHNEHLHRADFRRLYPPALKQGTPPSDIDLTGLSEANKIQMLWYQGKCNVDITWCA